MADEPKSSPKIKVVDRRWFTESGDPRVEEPSSGGTQPPPSGVEAVSQDKAEPVGDVRPHGASTEPSKRKDRGAEQEDRPEVSFLHLVNFMGQQAVLLLHGAEGLPKDPEQARLFIDFLVLLEAKTAGNLTPEEARFLSEMLFQLRTMFIQATA